MEVVYILNFIYFFINREKKDELPHMQVGFIDTICLPLYKVLSDTFPWIQPLYTGTWENRQRWKDLAEKVEMGLTWIDHDTIDKPIEEFTGECLFYLFRIFHINHYMLNNNNNTYKTKCLYT